MKKILVFSPYAARYHVFAYDGTIAKACEMRGVTVEYLLCNGLLPECDMHWKSFPENGPRPADLCQSCQARVKRNFSDLDIPLKDLSHRWLGEFLTEAEKDSAFTWASKLAASEMRQASFQDYHVGEWVQSSVISYFRQYPIEMNNQEVSEVYRGFLVSGALVVFSLTNYLKMHGVDAVLLFNGRQSITRVAFEVFRRFGIRVLTHEIPFFQLGHLMLKANARCWSIEPFTEFWRIWEGIPLTREALEQVKDWMTRRRYGDGLSWYAYNAPQTSDVSIRQFLKLSPRKKLLALFTSSTDETAGDPELQGPFEPQSEWVQAVVEWMKGRNDVELVIRVHPNLAGKTGLGRAVDEYNFYERLRENVPANTRVVMPDHSLNSYALMDEADVCLSFGSSVGIEMALLGKPVVLAARAPYEDCAHVLNISSKQSLPNMLEKSLRPMSVMEIRRSAFRLAYYYVFKFELPFPLIARPGIVDVRLNYTTSEALKIGNDQALDHICNWLIHGKPLFDAPTETERFRTTGDEDAFFNELETMQEPFRDMAHERSLRKLRSTNRLGRSIQSGLRQLPFGIGDFLAKVGKALYAPWLYPKKRSL